MSEPYPVFLVVGSTHTTHYIEIVPVTRDIDGPCTTECDSGDRSAQVKQENSLAVKQEPDNVCSIVTVM